MIYNKERASALYKKALSYFHSDRKILIDITPEKEFYEAQAESDDIYIYDIKLNMFEKNTITNAASSILYNYKIDAQCAIVEFMKKDSRFILMGKTNCEEFAAGTYGINSMYGVVMHEGKLVGGSSCGSAVAALEFSDVSFGTDTGGSCRFPALCVGIYGYKPSYGLISRFMIIEYGQSLDTVGLLFKEPEIAYQALKSVVKKDARDNCCIGEQAILRKKINKGIILYNDKFNENERKILNKISSIIKTEIKEYEFNIELVSFVYITIANIELYSSCSKYCELRYGNINELDAAKESLKTRYDKFGAHVLAAFINSGVVLGTKEYRYVYDLAIKYRTDLFHTVRSMIEQDEIIIMPSFSPDADALDALLCIANLAGLPSIVIPANHNYEPGDNKVAFSGVIIIGKYGSDFDLFELLKEIHKKI